MPMRRALVKPVSQSREAGRTGGRRLNSPPRCVSYLANEPADALRHAEYPLRFQERLMSENNGKGGLLRSSAVVSSAGSPAVG